MSEIGLSPEEELNLKTISEFLFFDEYKDYATYNRFEQCFQPLFNNISISIETVFKGYLATSPLNIEKCVLITFAYLLFIVFALSFSI